jgi:hypothetical protein
VCVHSKANRRTVQNVSGQLGVEVKVQHVETRGSVPSGMDPPPRDISGWPELKEKTNVLKRADPFETNGPTTQRHLWVAGVEGNVPTRRNA